MSTTPPARTDEQQESGVLCENEVANPRLYQVILHNDDYTTMDFVIQILMTFFRLNIEEATNVMLAVHREGAGVAGVYPLEIAETKVSQVHESAAEAGFPLRCSLREVDA